MRIVAAIFTLLVAAGSVLGSVGDAHDDCKTRYADSTSFCWRLDMGDERPTSPVDTGRNVYVFFVPAAERDSTESVATQAVAGGPSVPTSVMPIVYGDTNGYEGLQVQGKIIAGRGYAPDQAVLG